MKKSISIIGGGPAALSLAAHLDSQKFDVTIYEKNKTLGRKFLVAGNGGFNLTHSEAIATFIEQYSPSTFLKQALSDFDNQHFRNWLSDIGIATYVGSSKRVYPESGIKPIQVLNTILNVLHKNDIKIAYSHTWTGWDNKHNLVFNKDTVIKSAIHVFALGGGSWKVTGSEGNWLDLFEQQGHETVPFQASNCAFQVQWPIDFIDKHEGIPLKNIAISCQDKTQKGEAVITRFGIEGNAIYALSPQIRTMLNEQQKATVYLDLKPTLSEEDLFRKMKKSNSKNTSEILRNELKLSSVQLALLKTAVPKDNFLNLELLAKSIKKLPLTLTGTSLLDDAISTVGGIHLNAVDKNYQLKNSQHQYCIGEMLDWDAPTGGYLLQACFSMGVHLARHLNSSY